MSEHSVPKAIDRLPKLIDRALRVEGVVITRDGRPVVELQPIPPRPEPIPAEVIDRLTAQRLGERVPTQDATTLVGQMRDEW